VGSERSDTPVICARDVGDGSSVVDREDPVTEGDRPEHEPPRELQASELQPASGRPAASQPFLQHRYALKSSRSASAQERLVPQFESATTEADILIPCT